jgi:hypothetical protein
MRDDAFIRPDLEVRFSVVDTVDKIIPAIRDAVAAQGGIDAGSPAVAKL